MRPSKKSRDLITIFVFFERSYVLPHTCKVLWLGLNWFRIYGGDPFGRRLFNVKEAGYSVSKVTVARRGQNCGNERDIFSLS